MQLTIDSSESLTDVLRTVGALYSVTLTVAEGEAPAAAQEAPAPTRSRSSRSAASRTSTATRTPARGRGRATGGRRAAKPGSTAARRLAAEIRAWAAANGHEVSPRGRIPSNVVQAYEAAQH